MKRVKRYKIKTEQAESSSHSREREEHDLAYYIHDRVELMHQVFSVLKYKDLKAMAPECVRNLTIGDLQELCTEELLGISSKRLLATLDGAEPPSDTESSSESPTPDQMETISLDSISSDEEILSQATKKKKHKHRRNSKSKKKRKSKEPSDNTEVSRASRAGLTVLELLELQARARAIRAQLQNEQAKKQTEPVVEADSSSDDEVEIKEEQPDVVEISSGDEKPDLTALQRAAENVNAKESTKAIETSEKPKEPTASNEPTKPKETTKTDPQPEEDKEKGSEKTTVTRRVSDLVITVPQAKTTRKIKLKRNKVTVTVPNVPSVPTDRIVEDKEEKDKKKQKKKKKKKDEGSDHDEITLQLSDSEKMDLLEDLNEKNYDRLSSSFDSESSSSSDESSGQDKNSKKNNKDVTATENTESKETIVQKDNSNEAKEIVKKVSSYELVANSGDGVNKEIVAKDKYPSDTIDTTETVQKCIETNSNSEDKEIIQKDKDSSESNTETIIEKEKDSDNETRNELQIPEDITESAPLLEKTSTETLSQVLNSVNESEVPEISKSHDSDQNIDIQDITTKSHTETKDDEINKDGIDKTITVTDDAEKDPKNVDVTDKTIALTDNVDKDLENIDVTAKISTSESNITEESLDQDKEADVTNNAPINDGETNKLETNKKDEVESTKESERDISEGELTDRESSEVEAVDIEPEVVCISDEEKKSKKKKKKDKKAKKEKKSKKSKQDFREGGDQNFYKDNDSVDSNKTKDIEEIVESTTKVETADVIDIDDDVYEILELSDDSSCYEVEGTVISKEPTAEEIEALSARIDEINTETVDNSSIEDKDETDEIETHMSWKERYLDSNKVKRVLTTANILNALRKKNKELKKKIQESKDIEPKEFEKVPEGSIEQYEALPAGTTFATTEEKEVEPVEGEKTDEDAQREMKKNAKQLLKMYKKLVMSRKMKRREKKMKRKLKKQLQGADGDASEAEN